MRISACIAAQLVALPFALAQDDARYQELTTKAFALYEQKDFKGSATTYSAAFEALGWKGGSNDRYNAACSWALAGAPDSAFFQLELIAWKMDYANLSHITTDPDLNSLHADARWQPLLDQVKANKDRIEVNYDKPLMALLDSIYEEDQGLRRQIEEVEAKHGRDSEEMKAHWQRIGRSDSLNLMAVTRILDERGWLGPDVVGPRGNSTLFLVVQHADLATQEKYLPAMREAMEQGKARGSDLALLEDRVLMRNGKRQLYGSQIGRDPGTGAYFLSPLEDPMHVDERRAAMGLGPLSDYLRNWDLVWDPEAYERGLPALEQKLEQRKER
ncbi:MAG: DUF6624 domain-containing protein [Flavobacteriales bacterium]